jgi:hypothetical protein
MDGCMNKLALPVFLLGILAVTGCSHGYVMTLSNGNRITTANKPRLDHGTYVYKDAMGRENSLPAGRVREISPTSMTKEEKPRYAAPLKKQ